MKIELVEPGHELVIGTIGMGKSFWVIWKIIQSFHYNRPCCYIDPKGDTYQALLSYFVSAEGRPLWRAFRHKIILLNPVTKSDFLVGFNAIEPVEEMAHVHADLVALVANALTSHIRRQSGFDLNEANRMQNIMAAAVASLVEGGKGNLTLAELPLLFVPTYRKDDGRSVNETFNPFVRLLLQRIKHHGANSFWRDQWATWPPNVRREWVQSTEGRIFQYLFNEMAMLTTCTVLNRRLNFRDLIDRGYWLFVNLPYQLLTDSTTTMLGNLLISRIFHACMQRQPNSPPYRLILDEARFFNSGPLDVILETSRAYNLWMTLIMQSLDQMARSREGHSDYHLRQTALNNSRYVVAFKNNNPEDLELLAGLMFPVTGMVEIGTRKSGDAERLAVQAEIEEHHRRISYLQKRQVIVFDTQNPAAQLFETPEVRIQNVGGDLVNQFEAHHLSRIGVPVAQIRQEVSNRQEKIRQLLEGSQARTVPPADVGGQL